jgi:hypothetical protein
MSAELDRAEARAIVIDAITWLESAEAYLLEALPSDPRAFNEGDPVRLTNREVAQIASGLGGVRRSLQESLALSASPSPLPSKPTADTSTGARMERLGLRVIDGGQRDQSDNAA